MNVQCTSRTSEDARAVTTVLSQRNGCLRTGHGHSTFAFSSQTGNQSHLLWITLRISLCSEVWTPSAPRGRTWAPAREWELDSGAVQHHGQNPTARPAPPNAYWFSDTAKARNTPGWKVLPSKPEQEQPNTFNCISLQTSTSKDFSIRLQPNLTNNRCYLSHSVICKSLKERTWFWRAHLQRFS